MAMLREMRAISKYVFWIVAVAFIGWLAYGQVQEILTGSRDMVLKIDGTEIHATQFQQAVQAAVEQYQARNGVSQLPAEDRRQIEDQVVDELVRSVLIQHETHRLGITVTDQEIRDAAQTSPPPEVFSYPDFQTNGQFDAAKWRRFLQSGANTDRKSVV